MKSFQKKAVEQILAKKSLSPNEQRRLWAMASTAKKMILEIVFPQLYDLRTRVTALEALLSEEQFRELEGLREKAQARPEDRDLLHYMARSGKPVWDKKEDQAKDRVVATQRKAVLKSAGVDE